MNFRRRAPSNPSLRGGRPAGNAGRASNVEPSVNALGLIVLARPAGNDRHNTRPQPRHSDREPRGIRGIYSLGGLALCGCHPVVLGLDGLRENPVVRKANSGEIPRPSTNFSSATKRPSLRGCAAGPEPPFSGSAPNFSAIDHWLHGTAVGVVIGCIVIAIFEMRVL